MYIIYDNLTDYAVGPFDTYEKAEEYSIWPSGVCMILELHAPIKPVKPRSEERQLWKDKYGDKEDIQ